MSKLSPDEYAELVGKLLELRKEYGDLVLKIELLRPDEVDKELARQIHSLEASIIHPSDGLIVRSNKNTERIRTLKRMHLRDNEKVENAIKDINKNIEVSELLRFKSMMVKGMWILFSLLVSVILTAIGFQLAPMM